MCMHKPPASRPSWHRCAAAAWQPWHAVCKAAANGSMNTASHEVRTHLAMTLLAKFFLSKAQTRSSCSKPKVLMDHSCWKGPAETASQASCPKDLAWALAAFPLGHTWLPLGTPSTWHESSMWALSSFTCLQTFAMELLTS